MAVRNLLVNCLVDVRFEPVWVSSELVSRRGTVVNKFSDFIISNTESTKF